MTKPILLIKIPKKYDVHTDQIEENLQLIKREVEDQYFVLAIPNRSDINEIDISLLSIKEANIKDLNDIKNYIIEKFDLA